MCHEVGGPALFGSRPSLSLNSNLHSAVPDNLIQVILHGIASPASSDLGYMPGFKDSMTDRQIAELVAWLRQQFAPGKAGVDRAWTPRLQGQNRPPFIKKQANHARAGHWLRPCQTGKFRP